MAAMMMAVESNFVYGNTRATFNHLGQQFWAFQAQFGFFLKRIYAFWAVELSSQLKTEKLT